MESRGGPRHEANGGCLLSEERSVRKHLSKEAERELEGVGELREAQESEKRAMSEWSETKTTQPTISDLTIFPFF
ncbi:hypothetical protein I79_020353 [Cricetulus griseus]|uniref:Uncharacterized protein n=1 Tax=Cricetulus griseus TaxID=10029 RepID=G3I9U3_CRIGR|nr:hypothetical protein I79_020353 [Cricetulus griseus]